MPFESTIFSGAEGTLLSNKVMSRLARVQLQRLDGNEGKGKRSRNALILSGKIYRGPRANVLELLAGGPAGALKIVSPCCSWGLKG